MVELTRNWGALPPPLLLDAPRSRLDTIFAPVELEAQWAHSVGRERGREVGRRCEPQSWCWIQKDAHRIRVQLPERALGRVETLGGGVGCLRGRGWAELGLRTRLDGQRGLGAACGERPCPHLCRAGL